MLRHGVIFAVSNDISGSLLGGVNNSYPKASEWSWQIDAEGLRYSLSEIYDRCRIPRMVVENGLSAFNKVEKDGVDPRDYIDLVSASLGNLSRRRKKSFDWYKKVIATNGEDLI